jgi:hypothetical protein
LLRASGYRIHFVSYFHDAIVRSGGKVYRFPAVDGRALESPENGWFGPSDPSNGLAVATYLSARRKADSAPREVALELASQTLGITVAQLMEAIEWYENYVRWRDGTPDYRIL